MNQIVTRALAQWGMAGAELELIAARENEVFRVLQGDRSFALRLHRQGYRTYEELVSELDWMDAASRGGILVPAPVADRDGKFLHLIDGRQVDVLTWLPGQPLSTPG